MTPAPDRAADGAEREHAASCCHGCGCSTTEHTPTPAAAAGPALSVQGRALDGRDGHRDG